MELTGRVWNGSLVGHREDFQGTESLTAKFIFTHPWMSHIADFGQGGKTSLLFLHGTRGNGGLNKDW